MAAVYHTRSWVQVSRAVTRGEPRKKRKPKFELQHWKFSTQLLNGRYVWHDCYGTDELDALCDFFDANPELTVADIHGVVFMGSSRSASYHKMKVGA